MCVCMCVCVCVCMCVCVCACVRACARARARDSVFQVLHFTKQTPSPVQVTAQAGRETETPPDTAFPFVFAIVSIFLCLPGWPCALIAIIFTRKVSAAQRLVGLVGRRPPRERKIPGSNPACDGIFSGSSHTSDLEIGTPLATLPGAWRYRVSAGTGLPGVSIL